MTGVLTFTAAKQPQPLTHKRTFAQTSVHHLTEPGLFFISDLVSAMAPLPSGPNFDPLCISDALTQDLLNFLSSMSASWAKKS